LSFIFFTEDYIGAEEDVSPVSSAAKKPDDMNPPAKKNCVTAKKMAITKT
jgi:hypothetical protein